MKTATHFRAGTRAFWGTTYAFALGLFDQYLLRQLGGPPLNAVVLVDHWKLSDTWNRLAPDDHYLARQANRVYLLRPIRLPGDRAFHPKTYLFARRDEATLLVGSGNLTRSGLDSGKEVFTSFDTNTDVGLATLRAWASWIGGLVTGAEDDQLTRRFAALRDECSWMHGEIGATPFAVNAQRPLLDQFVDRLPGTVDELHITAPYYDRDARALGEALARIQPRQLNLYFGLDTSVHGPSLAAVVGAAGCEVHLHRFEPATFVHAKLLGAVCGDGGVLLSGSPNLSLAALTLTYGETGRGNCEVGLLQHGSADQVRAPFLSAGHERVDITTANLHELAFNDDESMGERPRITLSRATWTPDGRISVNTDKEPEAGDRLAWAHGAAALAGRATAEAIADHAQPPLLAWLAGPSGEPASNAIAIDDPGLLDRSMASRDPARDRPSELQEHDAQTPLGMIMSWLHQQCIFDIDDTAAARRAQAAQGGTPDQESTDFWERLQEEELNYDPRTRSYRRMGPSNELGNDLFRELEIMLAKAPFEYPLLRLAPSDVSGEHRPIVEAVDHDLPRVTWSMEARQRVRVVNVLSRWCRAVSDPRHALIRPDAPVTNYEALLTVIELAWVQKALDEDRLVRLAGELFGAFLGDGRSPGFLVAQIKSSARRRFSSSTTRPVNVLQGSHTWPCAPNVLGRTSFTRGNPTCRLA